MISKSNRRLSPLYRAHRMLASSLLILFSSKSRALAFLKSAMNWTSPRIFAVFVPDRPRKPPEAMADMLEAWGSEVLNQLRWCKLKGRVHWRVFRDRGYDVERPGVRGQLWFGRCKSLHSRKITAMLAVDVAISTNISSERDVEPRRVVAGLRGSSAASSSVGRFGRALTVCFFAASALD